MSYTELSRRKFIQLSAAGIITTAIMPTQALASFASKPRTITLNNLHTGEKLETCYFVGARYVSSELARINHICRDFRRNESHPMDRALLDKISAIQSVLGTEAEVQIISGYRSPATNEMLRGKSSGVAKKSYHMLGQAIDFRLEGVDLADVRKAAISLKAGGVGYYPGSNFVHIDTGPARAW